MALRAVTLILVGLPFLSACRGHDDGTQGQEHAQLEAMERRLDALDQRLAATEKDLAAGARLSNDVHALQERLAAAEGKVTQALDLAKRPPPPPAAATGTAAAPARPAAPDPIERREQLSALMTEYRRRLAAVASQDAQAAPADRLAAPRAVREGYIAHRRAILTRRPPRDRQRPPAPGRATAGYPLRRWRSGEELWAAGRPRRRTFELRRHAEQQILSTEGRRELHADGQPVRRPVQRQRDRRLPRHVERQRAGAVRRRAHECT